MALWARCVLPYVADGLAYPEELSDEDDGREQVDEGDADVDFSSVGVGIDSDDTVDNGYP